MPARADKAGGRGKFRAPRIYGKENHPKPGNPSNLPKRERACQHAIGAPPPNPLLEKRNERPYGKLLAPKGETNILGWASVNHFSSDQATERQRRYYNQTAREYDRMHDAETGEHALALKYVLALCRQYGLQSILDVGCGTGVALRTLLDKGMEAKGIEPVDALVRIGMERRRLRPSEILVAAAESIPFPKQSFDAVTEFAVLHHIKNPAPAVGEMIRVARHAIFLSDENRFGRGSLAWRLIKYFWWKTGVFPLGFWLTTKGKGYNFTPGDGVSYSYSVFDSVRQLRAWANAIFFIPLKKASGPGWAHPLFSSSHVLLCAFRHPEATAP